MIVYLTYLLTICKGLLFTVGYWSTPNVYLNTFLIVSLSVLLIRYRLTRNLASLNFILLSSVIRFSCCVYMLIVSCRFYCSLMKFTCMYLDVLLYFFFTIFRPLQIIPAMLLFFSCLCVIFSGVECLSRGGETKLTRSLRRRWLNLRSSEVDRQLVS